MVDLSYSPNEMPFYNYGVGGPDLSYEPEDLPNLTNTNPTFSDYLGMFGRTIAGPASSLLSSTSKKKNAQEPLMSRAPQGRQGSYMAQGSMGRIPDFQSSNPMANYGQMSQQAFRNALVNLILSNPRVNIKGLL